jgi:DNA-binding PadR family transcriptional regulator
MQEETLEVKMEILRGLLDLLILQFLRTAPIPGNQIISDLQKRIGVPLGPNTICPLLGSLEEKGYVQGRWDLEADQPNKTYVITPLGKILLTNTKESLDRLLQRFLLLNSP